MLNLISVKVMQIKTTIQCNYTHENNFKWTKAVKYQVLARMQSEGNFHMLHGNYKLVKPFLENCLAVSTKVELCIYFGEVFHSYAQWMLMSIKRHLQLCSEQHYSYKTKLLFQWFWTLTVYCNPPNLENCFKICFGLPLSKDRILI